jgi:ribosomal protein S18 acetylase RimI-like enzyme
MIKDNFETSIELVSKFTDEYLKSILDLEKKCFPEDWQYEDAGEYYGKMLKSERNINIFLRKKGEIVGYVLAKPFEEAVKELKELDPELENASGKYYIETIQILPEARGFGGAKKLIFAVCEEANKKGVIKFSIHARTTNRFSDKIKKMFEGKITEVRKIENWKPANGEPYEYLEWSY